MLSVDSGLDPLLKRPFSLHRWLNPDFQLLYRIVGKATKILKEKKQGDILEIIGPLGNGFPITRAKTKAVLIAGGLGIVPIFALAETISESTLMRRGNSKKNPIFFFGAKTKKELLCVNELKSIGVKPIVSTDDGTLGQKGTIVDVLSDFLTSLVSRPSSLVLYACGPKPMLRELSRLRQRYELKGYIALEENMACGIGACQGCTVKTKDGFKRVCKEGPVFPMEEISWEEVASNK